MESSGLLNRLIFLSVLGCSSIFIYLLCFLLTFDIFSLPVRNDTGWIGPKLWRNPHVEDIGKVLYYTGNATIYQYYSPLCKLWLLPAGAIVICSLFITLALLTVIGVHYLLLETTARRSGHPGQS